MSNLIDPVMRSVMESHVVYLWLLLTMAISQVSRRKVLPYSLPSVGTGADPGVQAVTGFSLSWLQKNPGLSRPQKYFSGPCCKPAMSKYSNQEQLMSLRAVSYTHLTLPTKRIV